MSVQTEKADSANWWPSEKRNGVNTGRIFLCSIVHLRRIYCLKSTTGTNRTGFTAVKLNPALLTGLANSTATATHGICLACRARIDCQA